MVRDWLMLQNDTVINSVLWDADGVGQHDWDPPAGVEMIAREDAAGADIGWTRVAGLWTPPS